VNDAYELERFVNAQGPVIDQVRAELRAGRKQGHWMWFVFPQFRGLGHSAMAQRFGIGSREEAEAYLLHPTLGPRLRECTSVVNAVEGLSAHEIFGYPDDLKFNSSMTLFAHIAADNDVFKAAVDMYFGGAFDQLTLNVIGTATKAATTRY
jgi:uncharacterized protein (DUF1810 family)